MRFQWLLPSILGIVVLSSPANAAKLLTWQFNANRNRLEFTTDQNVQPRIQLLTNPTRLIIDLPGIVLKRPPVEQLMGGAIRSVRVGQFNSKTTRLVIELNPGYTITRQQVQLGRISSRHWTVELPTLDGVAQYPNPMPLPPLNPDTPPDTSYPPVDLPRINQGRIVVVIDPGHGGGDPGAIGIGRIREKDIVLPIAQRVTEILARQGVQAILTRTSDYELDLEPRVQIARRDRANLFVSIHANSIANRPDVNGLETYYYDRGQRLAQIIHNSILQSIDIRDRRVRRARFYVLRNNPMPAVLVEVGFVTGNQDARKLATTEYQDRMAEAIANGILQYIQQYL